MKDDIKKFINQVLSFFCLSIAFSFFCKLQVFFSGDGSGLIYIRLLYYTNLLSLSIFLYFVLHFCKDKIILKNKVLSIVLFSPVFLFGIISSTDYIVYSVENLPHGKTIIHGSIYPLFLFILLFYFLLSIIILLSSYKSEESIQFTRRKVQIGYLLVGILIGGGIGQVVNILLPLFTLFNYPAEDAAKILWMGFSVYVLKVRKPLSLDVFLSKTIVYYLVSLGAISVYILGIKQVGVYFGKMFKSFPLIVESSVLVGFAFLFKPLVDAVENIVNRKLFPSLFSSSRFLSEFGNLMTSCKSIEELSSEISHIISEKFGISKMFIILKNRKSGEFRIEKLQGIRYQDIFPLISIFSSLFQNIKEKNKAIPVEKISILVGDEKTLLSWLREYNIGVIIPLVHHNEYLGILGIGEKEDGISFSEEEIDALSTISSQIIIFLENVYYLEDIRETYKILHQKEKLAILGEMSSVLAHEIKNPLSNIRGSAQILKNSDMTHEEREKFVNFIIEEIDRLNKLIFDFLGVAKTPTIQLNSYDLISFIDNILEQNYLEFKKHNIRVDKIFPEGKCMILTDGNLLRQVFLNIITNSCDAMKEIGSGVLTIRIENLTDKVRIEISDTGYGIEKEKLPLIFEPFWTTKSGGSGLGLFIVRKIISNIGGEVYAESPSTVIDGKEMGMKIGIILPKTFMQEERLH